MSKRDTRRDNMMRYGRPSNPGAANRAKRAALKKKMGPDKTVDSTCFYGDLDNQKFCTTHYKHH